MRMSPVKARSLIVLWFRRWCSARLICDSVDWWWRRWGRRSHVLVHHFHRLRCVVIGYISRAWRQRSRIIVVAKRGRSVRESRVFKVLLMLIWLRRRLATWCVHQLRKCRSIVVRSWQRRRSAIHGLRRWCSVMVWRIGRNAPRHVLRLRRRSPVRVWYRRNVHRLRRCRTIHTAPVHGSSLLIPGSRRWRIRRPPAYPSMCAPLAITSFVRARHWRRHPKSVVRSLGRAAGARALESPCRCLRGLHT
jgi:hypothetical protein